MLNSKFLLTITTEQQFDDIAEQLRTELFAHNKAKFSADKVCLNYFSDSEKLTLKNFSTGNVYVHSFNTTQVMGINPAKPQNKYFQQKKIKIENYANIVQDRNNWIIPIYDINFNHVSSQSIYYDYEAKIYQKRNKGDIVGNFFFYGSQNSDIMVVSEGVATLLAFSEFYKQDKPDVFYVSALTASNLPVVIKKLWDKLNQLKVIIVLTDNDEAGTNAFSAIKNLDLGNTLLLQIISNTPDENDFSDIFIANTQLVYIKNQVNNFLHNHGIFLTEQQGLYLTQIGQAKNKVEQFKNYTTETFLANLDQYKFKVANNSIYAINPENLTYTEISLHAIEEFLSDCIDKSRIFNLDIAKEAERIYKIVRRSRKYKATFNTAINCKNGSIDLTKREFSNKYSSTTKHVNFRYYDNEEYELKFNNSSIKQFLNSTLPDNEDLIMLQDCIGYLLTNNKQEYLIMLCGSGSNGKSVLLDLMKRALPGLTVSTSLDNALNNENSRSLIKDKLLAVSSEFSGVIKHPETFKTLISREPLQYKELYKDVSLMENYARFIVASNELPIASTLNSNALMRRLAVLEFKQIFKPNQEYTEHLFQDENIELFYNYLIRCAFNYQYEIKISTNSKELLNNIKTGIDSVYGFLQEKEISSGEHLISASDLYKQYLDYCYENSIKENNNSNFGRKLTTHGILKKRLSSGNFYMINQGVIKPRPF